MTPRPILTLHPGKEKSLLRRHPWLFSGAVARTQGHPADGDLVDIHTADGTWMATAHYTPGTITAKILSFTTPEVDPDQHPHFWAQRLLAALDYRRRLGLIPMTNTNALRLIHSEGDNLPGLIADYYAGLVVLQAHSMGMHRMLPLWTHLLQTHLPAYLPLHAIYNKSAATLPTNNNPAPLDPPDGYLYGTPLPEWTIQEHGLTYYINPQEAQKTGFFIDQRDSRHLLTTLAAGRRVLNTFGYTGGFTLAALAGGATYVETVDISKKAIDLCNRNVAHNYPHAPHRGTVADALQYLTAPTTPFDIIILDPPAFAKNHKHLAQGLKGYKTINQKALQHITPGGLLLTYSCSQAVTPADFQTMIFTAAANAHRHVRIVRTLTQAPDHPVSIYHPEGHYLKGLLLYVE